MQGFDPKIPFGKSPLKKEPNCQDIEELVSKTDLSLAEKLNIARHCSKCPTCENKFRAKLEKFAKET